MKTIKNKEKPATQAFMQDLDKLNLNMFFNLCWISSKKTSVSSFYKENNFKPCLTKQLLNMFKLWCERGVRKADTCKHPLMPRSHQSLNVFKSCLVKHGLKLFSL